MTSTDQAGGSPARVSERAPSLAELPIDASRLPPAGSLRPVLEGKELIKYMPGLVDAEYCRAAMAALTDLSYRRYEIDGVDTSGMFKFGPSVLDQYLGLERPTYELFVERYFSVASDAHAQLDGRFKKAGIVDPLEILLAVLRHTWDGPAELATEGERQYFAGIVRALGGGAPPHTDNAKRAPDLSIAQTTVQGSILIYLEMPDAGGGVRVFDKRSTPSGFDGEVGWEHVVGATFVGVTPRAGDVVLFPTTHFHSVDPVIGEARRITISSFFGALPDGRLVLWS